MSETFVTGEVRGQRQRRWGRRSPLSSIYHCSTELKTITVEADTDSFKGTLDYVRVIEEKYRGVRSYYRDIAFVEQNPKRVALATIASIADQGGITQELLTAIQAGKAPVCARCQEETPELWEFCTIGKLALVRQ